MIAYYQKLKDESQNVAKVVNRVVEEVKEDEDMVKNPIVMELCTIWELPEPVEDSEPELEGESCNL